MNKLKTQLGGKFSKQEQGLFELRTKLIDAGIEVEFPFNDGIVGVHNGIEVTFIPTESRSFYDVEIEFFSAIKNNSIHIVHNKFVEKVGYIGESASIELAYALLHNKPVVLLYEPVFSDKVPEILQNTIRKNLSKVNVKRLDLMEKEELINYLSQITGMQYNYIMDVRDEVKIMEIVNNLLNSYNVKG